MKCLVKESTKIHIVAPIRVLIKTNTPAICLLTKMHINCGKIQTARPIPDLFEILGRILFKN